MQNNSCETSKAIRLYYQYHTSLQECFIHAIFHQIFFSLFYRNWFDWPRCNLRGWLGVHIQIMEYLWTEVAFVPWVCLVWLVHTVYNEDGLVCPDSVCPDSVCPDCVPWLGVPVILPCLLGQRWEGYSFVFADDLKKKKKKKKKIWLFKLCQK